jgi:hypothetical protein
VEGKIMKYGKRRSRKGDSRFNPKRADIEKAVADYLNGGGKITKLEFDERAFRSFMESPENPTEVDDFLNGGL